MKANWIFALLLFLLSYNPFRPSPQEPRNFKASENPVLRTLSEHEPPCLGMVKTFCESLYSPDHQGKMEIPLSDETLEIRRGKTENDFSQVYYEYAQTQIKHRENLPKSFKEVLTQRGYFRKLRTYLSRKPTSKMTFNERIAFLRLSDEIDATWNGAINEAVLKRMERKYPGYSKIPEDLMPMELKYERRRVRSVLISEISKAVWANHPNWKKVEKQFREVRRAYHSVISLHPRLPAEIKNDWLQRIDSVQLIVPGSDPEVEMYACSRTEENAYYYTFRNSLTVCAGDFNAEDMRQTIAHELAHTLDINRTIAIFENKSFLGKRLEELKNQSCYQKNYSCSDWENFKMEIGAHARTVEKFKPQLSEFNRCLKGKETMSPIPEDYLMRVAKEEVQDTTSGLAGENVFLRIITPKLPMPDGNFHQNPMHLNPCGYYLWNHQSHSFDEELTLLLFFTSEYQCSADLPADMRFQKSIESAIALQTKLVFERMRLEGEFSSRWRPNADHYAISPAERFADALAGLALAHILEKEKNIKRRRAIYLSNIGWLCPRPSLKQLYPVEARIQKSFHSEPHSEDSVRQKEILSEEMRNALQCHKDFDIQECELGQ